MDKNSISDFFKKTKELIIPKNKQSFKVSRKTVAEFMQSVSDREDNELYTNHPIGEDYFDGKVFKGVKEEFSAPIYHSVSADIKLMILAQKNREHYTYFEALSISRTAMLAGEADGDKALIVYFRVEELDAVFYFVLSRYNGGKLHLDLSVMSFSNDEEEFDAQYYSFCFK